MTRRISKKLKEKLISTQKFVEQYIDEHGYSPAVRDIEKGVGYVPSLVKYYLDRLEELGHITRQPNIARSIRVIKPIDESIQERSMTVQRKVQDTWRIRIIGPIVAGEPILTPSSDFNIYDGEDTIDIVPSQLSDRGIDQNEVYALRVQGDSMIDDMINDGDTVIMLKTQDAQNGDTVAVWLPDDEETTLKRFYREQDRIRLQPANPTMDPIYIPKTQPIEIQGKVLQTISSK